ncbi:MAG: hypothetical protein JST70_05280 [Bacteroidetes bacterium]|nr:hypothetical protein [Bacteroidota bacterium]
MKQTTRELLVTTKVANNWQDNFEEQVEHLISIISQIDNEANVVSASETLDVYHTANKKPRKARRKKTVADARPFEFLVFRN